MAMQWTRCNIGETDYQTVADVSESI